MKKIVRKCTSVVLAMVIVLCSLSMVAFAEEAEPTAVCTHTNAHVSYGDDYYRYASYTTHYLCRIEYRDCLDCNSGAEREIIIGTGGHVFGGDAIGPNGEVGKYCVYCHWFRENGVG